MGNFPVYVLSLTTIWKQVDVFPYLKTKRFCVLLHYLKLPLV